MSGRPGFGHATPRDYWDARAARFAAEGAGLRAVCSYGMPAFYNRYIDLTQRLALAPWLAVAAGTAVLDVGCGIGRWSRHLAAKGAVVTGVDLSAAMIAEAKRRGAADGLNCRFLVQDLADLDTGGRHHLILGVTVLQHILDPARLDAAIARLAAHLAPGGRLVLLEAAPTGPRAQCDTPIFTARTRAFYEAAFARAGLRMVATTGVDPCPLKTRLLPAYGRLPAVVAQPAMLAVTALSLPVDALFGRRLTAASWHKVFVLSRDAD